MNYDAGRGGRGGVPRFTQPDTIIPNPANPQDLNRYTYVRNNPVAFNDPSGHCGKRVGERAYTCEDAAAIEGSVGGRSRIVSSRSEDPLAGSPSNRRYDAWDYRVDVAEVSSRYEVDAVVLYAIVSWEYQRGGLNENVPGLLWLRQQLYENSFGITNLTRPQLKDVVGNNWNALLQRFGGHDSFDFGHDADPYSELRGIVDSSPVAALEVTAIWLQNRIAGVESDHGHDVLNDWIIAASGYNGFGRVWRSAARGDGALTASHWEYIDGIQGDYMDAQFAMCTGGLECTLID